MFPSDSGNIKACSRNEAHKMAQTTGQRRATGAVAAVLAYRKWNNTDLIARTGTDTGTIGDFLLEQRWPKTATQGKIEEALGWPPGTIRAVSMGADPPPIDTEWESAAYLAAIETSTTTEVSNAQLLAAVLAIQTNVTGLRKDFDEIKLEVVRGMRPQGSPRTPRKDVSASR
jgi:hypothetical protein